LAAVAGKGDSGHMLIVVWSLALGLLVACYAVKFRLGRLKRTASIEFLIASSLMEILAIYLAVGALFLAGALWAGSADRPDTTLQKLWDWEQRLGLLKSVVAKLRVPAGFAVGVLLICAMLGMRPGRRWFRDLYSRFNWYRKQTKRIGIAAAALTSFSIFSGTVPSTHARIETRIKRTEKKYSSYRRALGECDREAAIAGTLHRISKELPGDWKTVVLQKQKIAQQEIKVVNQILRLKTEYGVEVASFPDRFDDSPGQATADPMPKPPGNGGDPNIWPEPDERGDRNEEAAVSEESLDRLQVDLHKWHAKVLNKMGDLLSTALGEKLPESSLEPFLSHANWSSLKALGDSYPLLDALLGVLDKAVREVLGKRVKDAVVRLAARAASENIGEDLDRSAGADVGSVELHWDVSAARIRNLQKVTKAKLAEVDQAMAVCDAFAKREETLIAVREARQIHRVMLEWEAAGNEFDRVHGFSLVRSQPGDPPQPTLAHYEGRKCMAGLIAQVRAEAEGEVRRDVLTEMTKAIREPGEYQDKMAKLNSIVHNRVGLSSLLHRQGLLSVGELASGLGYPGLQELPVDLWYSNPLHYEARLRLEAVGRKDAEDYVQRGMAEYRERASMELAKSVARINPPEAWRFRIGDWEFEIPDIEIPDIMMAP
jgi:hypothetical protein